MRRVYSYSVVARILDAGKGEPEYRKAFVAETSPERAIAEAKRQLCVDEAVAGRVVDWVLSDASENNPVDSRAWCEWHAVTDASADTAEGAEDALQCTEQPEATDPELSTADAAAQA